MPTAGVSSTPPETAEGCGREDVVVGIRSWSYPPLSPESGKQLGKKVESLWVELGLDLVRELNSYDLALTLERPEVRQGLINKLKAYGVRDKLVLIPAVLGVNRWQEVMDNLEGELECKIMEVPTLPPSVMGYRLARSFEQYLKGKGVEFLIGNPVVYVNCQAGKCEEIGISTPTGRLKKITGEAFCLATGGILGEGLKVLPKGIKEQVFDYRLVLWKPILWGIFSLEEQPLSQAGIMVNEHLQPINPKTGQIVLTNVFIAGATLPVMTFWKRAVMG